MELFELLWKLPGYAITWVLDGISRGDWMQVAGGVGQFALSIGGTMVLIKLFRPAYRSGVLGVSLNEYELLEASENGNINKVRDFLLNGRANINMRDNKGRTPLMWACSARTSQDEMVMLLISRGAALDLRDKSGGHALMHAVMGGHSTSAKILIEQGADLNAALEDGLTALQIAYETQNSQMIELLENPPTVKKEPVVLNVDQELVQQPRKFKFKDLLANREIKSHSPIPLSIKSLSPNIFTENNQPTPNIRGV